VLKANVRSPLVLGYRFKYINMLYAEGEVEYRLGLQAFPIASSDALNALAPIFVDFDWLCQLCNVKTTALISVKVKLHRRCTNTFAVGEQGPHKNKHCCKGAGDSA